MFFCFWKCGSGGLWFNHLALTLYEGLHVGRACQLDWGAPRVVGNAGVCAMGQQHTRHLQPVIVHGIMDGPVQGKSQSISEGSQRGTVKGECWGSGGSSDGTVRGPVIEQLGVE